MRTLLLIWSLVIGHCLAGPFFFGQQGAVSAQIVPPEPISEYTPNDHGPAAVKWWIAARKESFADGDAVATATDWSSSAINATQSTAANRPTFKTEIVNGNAVFRADGVNDGFVLASNPLSGATAATAMFVVKINSDPPASANATGPVLGEWGTSSQNNHFPWTDGNIYDNTFISTRAITVNPSTTLAQFNQFTVLYSGGNLIWRMNGTQIATASATFALGSSPKVLWSNRASLFYYLSGDLAEVVMWNGALSGSDLTDEEAGLKTQYGTP